MRYGIWRWINNLGRLLIAISFAGMIFLTQERLQTAAEVLFWSSAALGGGFSVAVAILRARGRLRFVYSEADRFGYSRNAESLHSELAKNRNRKDR